MCCVGVLRPGEKAPQVLGAHSGGEGALGTRARGRLRLAGGGGGSRKAHGSREGRTLRDWHLCDIRTDNVETQGEREALETAFSAIFCRLSDRGTNVPFT